MLILSPIFLSILIISPILHPSGNAGSEEIIFGNKRIKFDIDPFKKKCLLNGLDDIALSLEKSDKISSYEDKIKKNKPWLN